MKDFRMLNVWELSHQLTLDIYKLTKSFPKDELYGLQSQIRRASVSIATNIAEGAGRSSDADFARFIVIAYGSANETDYLLLLSKDLAYISPSEYELLNTKVNTIKKFLHNLLKKLKEK